MRGIKHTGTHVAKTHLLIPKGRFFMLERTEEKEEWGRIEVNIKQDTYFGNANVFNTEVVIT